MAYFGETKIVLHQGDITEQHVDAIVNAANSSLLGGGGVDGAIHRAGGPLILEECRQIRARQGGCPVGEAVVTTAGQMPARMVIHTVGPVWHGGQSQEGRLLRQCYLSSLSLAARSGAGTIAFPSISTGAYGFPIEKASLIALSTVKEYCLVSPVFLEVRFILFSAQDLAIYKNSLKQLASAPEAVS